jgi:signal transduction histidine kinase
MSARMSGRGRPANAALVQLGFVAAYTVAGFLGRATVIDGGSLSLVWPAAGVAVLWAGWALSCGRGAVSVAAALLAVSTVVVSTVTDAPPDLVVVFVVANLGQAAAAVAVLGPTAAWPAPGPSRALPIETVRGAVRLVGGAAASAVLGAVVACIGIASALGSGAVTGSTFALWWGRNLTGTVAVVALVLLVAQRVRDGTPTLRRRGPGSAASALELAALVAVTTAAFAVLFQGSSASSFYPLLALTVWAGLRFSALVVTAYTTGFGAAAVALTLGGVGPFAAVDSLEVRAVDVQLFVAVSVLLGLVLAASLADQRRLVARSRAAEGEARARADLFAAVAEKIADSVVVLDASGSVVASNASARQLLDGLGLRDNRSAVLHRPDGARLERDGQPSVRAMREGSCPPTDVVLMRPGDRPVLLSITAARLDDVQPFADGPGAVVVYRDVTSEREQRDELAGFAGMVAHDLRSPLTAARGWLELAQLGLGAAADDEVSSWLGHAHQATVRMSDLVEDLLAHATSGGQHLDLVDVDLGGVLEEVVALHAADQAVTVGPLPAVRADAVMVRQLFTNLVGNALKYARPGVAARVVVDTGPQAPDGEVALRVTDNGLGIAPEDREAVFGRFYRAHRDHPDAAEVTGHGLGLAVCRTIVERHGGQIRVEDAPEGPGSRFVLTLPAARGTTERSRRDRAAADS